MSLVQGFSQFNSKYKASGEWSKVRKNALRFFETKGLPTRKDESWKYTSVKALGETRFNLPSSAAKPLTKSQQEQLLKYLNPGFTNIVFVDGVLSKENSDLKDLGKHCEWSLLGDVLQGKTFKHLISLFREQRQKVGSVRQDVFEALSSAFAWQGFVLEVKKETALKKPLQLIYFNRESSQALYPKNFLILGARSKLALIETYIGDGENQFLSHSTEVLLQQNSRLEYLRVQDCDRTSSNVGVSRFYVQKQAQLEALNFATGGRLSRHNLEIYICGAEAFARSQGLTLASDRQHFDNHTLIDHVVGGGQTAQFYKSILNDEAKSVFDGKVLIRKDAQKANSEQLAKALLLSSRAEADSKPNLEIYADDVKATHGATVGQLNEEEIFYLLSRAISRGQAIEMLSLGFVTDIIYQISNEKIQEWLLEILKSAYQRMKVS